MGLDSMLQILFMEDFKVRKRIGNIIRCVVFLTILVLSLYGINKVLETKTTMRNNIYTTTTTYNQFYKMQENTIDALFFGSSVAANAFIPQEIYNQYQIRTYNLATEQQSVFLSYYWLKEALRFQSPKVVILDTRFLFDIHPETPINTNEGLTRNCLDPMKWSKVKMEAVSELCKLDPAHSELSFYLTNIRFHDRWKAIQDHDMLFSDLQHNELKGYAPIKWYGPQEYTTFDHSGDYKKRVEPKPVMVTYLDKMVQLCKDHDIQLVLLSLPGNKMSDGYDNTLTDYAKTRSIDYYNLCETSLYQAIGAVLPKESVIEHGNLWGAMKISQFIGKMLAETYHVTGNVDEQYESTKEYYEQIIQNCELSLITDVDQYLEAIKDDRYTVFLSVYNDATLGLKESTKKALANLGLQKDLTGKYQWSYSAVISPEHGVLEELNENYPAVIRGSICNKRSLFTVSSSGALAGSSSIIQIDERSYSRGSRGMNIVVYDNQIGEVIDSVAFDTHGESGAVR